MKCATSANFGIHNVRLVFNYKFWLATIILSLIYSTAIFAQYTNTYFIDPSNTGDPEEDGSIVHPFDHISDVAIQSNTAYLFKRGSTMYSTSNVIVTMKSNIKFGVYGPGGERSTYQYNGSGSPVFNIYRECENIIVDSLIISGQIGNGVDALIQVGGYVSGTIPTSNVTISNCELKNAYNGVRSPFFSGGVGSQNITIKNCEVHNIEEDGFFMAECDNLTIENCHIYDVNLDWHLDCHTEACAPGDGIQIGNNSNNFLIKNNIIDRRGTGNKFCFIFGGLNTEHIVGNIIGNTFYPPIDTTDNAGGNAIYLSTGNGGAYNGTESITIAYNKFIGRGYASPNKATHAIFSVADTVYCYANLFDSIGTGSVFNQQSNHVEFYNNTMVTPMGGSHMIVISGVPSGVVRNNLAAANTTQDPLWIYNSNVVQSNNIQVKSAETSQYNSILGIVDWESGDYHRSSDLNDGVDVGLVCDLDSIYVADPPEAGAYEYTDGGQSNNPPVINNQSYDSEENSSYGQVIGVVDAYDPDPDQVISFSILSGNVENAFQIGAASGIITVANEEALNYENTPSFNLVIEVEDNGPGNLTDQAEITITLDDVNENPEIEDQNFLVDPAIQSGEWVGTVVGSDPDQGQAITFSIVQGNEDEIFSMDPTSGELIVLQPALLNFDQTPVWSLTVQVKDNGDGELTAEGTVSLSTEELNQFPVIEDQAFTVNENTSNGAVVGTVIASDPDEGQNLTYSIVSGNISNTFQINATTGVLSVANSGTLNYELHQVFILVVSVEDNGFGNLSSEGSVTVSLNDVNEEPEVQDQSFSLEENASAGTLIGNIVASDPDEGQDLSFTIVSGNIDNAFELNASTGSLSVNNSTPLNYEAYENFYLVIQVEDNGAGNLFDEATINIDLDDINESPIIADQSMSVNENSTSGTEVGTVVSSDPDAGQSLSYSIISGNFNDAFTINPATGLLSVSNEQVFDFEDFPAFELVIEVEDNGPGSLSAQGQVTVNLIDVNETPQIGDQYFSVDEFSQYGTEVGAVEATDPDEGQSLTYSITEGNTMDAFQIDPETGVLTVMDSAVLNMEINPVFILSVKVQDNGQGNLSADASVVIALIAATNVNDNQQSDIFAFQIFPNPVSDYLNFNFTSAESDEIIVKIFNYQGQIVYTNTYYDFASDFEDKINVSSWGSGYYIIHVQTSEQMLQTKMIKM